MVEGDAQARSAAINRFFEDAFDERVNRSPQTLTALGRKASQDQLDDQSDARYEADAALIREQLRRLGQFDLEGLPPADSLNARVFRSDAETTLERLRYRHDVYLINQKFGLHSDFPAFMINMHGIEDLDDARNYVARLHALPVCCDQVLEALEHRRRVGVVPPRFLFPQMLDDCRRFIDALESDSAVERSVLFEDLSGKLARIECAPDVRADLLHAARQALRVSVLPSYRKMFATLERHQVQAPEQAGAWALPDGEAYYAMCLRWHTSMGLSAEEVHRLGMEEVARIRAELESLRAGLGFQGTLDELFTYAREHPGFYHPQTEAGRRDYMEALNRAIRKAEAVLPQLFNVLPEDALLVKAVESHREQTAGLAFYQGPAADGTRPGIFYVNLYDLGHLPVFMTEALAYHEALPGHHMQFSIANRLSDIPTFRRYADYTAYVEGWALYSEQLARDALLYEDAWSDFGRLTQELKRACRLVVDTGLHAKRWTREQAVSYMLANTPSSRAQLVKEVDRYIVMPGQATSYTIGMIEILRMRAQAVQLLGAGFDRRAFHDELLRHGPLPLDLLSERIKAWAQDSG